MTQPSIRRNAKPLAVTVADHIDPETADRLAAFTRQHILAARDIHAAAQKSAKSKPASK